MPDPRLPVIRKAIATIIGDECKHWEIPRNRCELTPFKGNDACWCWQKALASADALDELAHNENIKTERGRKAPSVEHIAAAAWLRRHADAHAGKWTGMDARSALKAAADEMEAAL